MTPIDLEASLRSEILRYLPVRDRPDNVLAEHLENMRIDNLLVYFLNWRDRLVHAHPRKVKKSAELLANPIYLQRRNEVALICAKLAVGNDIGPHLSCDVRYGFQMPNPNRKRRRDLDLLLNEWGIHHLHLSSTIQAKGFVTRTDEVMFAIFREGFAYLLDIMPHRNWENEHLVRVAVQNWPGANLFHPLHLHAAAHISSEDRKVLRRAGVNTFVNIDGVSYMSGTGGLSSAGTTSRATMQCQRILRSIGYYANSPVDIFGAFKATPEFSGVKWPKMPRFAVVSAMLGNSFALCIREEISGTLLRLE